MGNSEAFIINSIVRICQKLDQRCFGANHDGNVTVKHGDVIFATPSATSKGDVTAEMIITLNLEGKKVAGYGKPFSEIDIHLTAYRARPDISAVVHAHPPYATARALVGLPLEAPSIAEAVVSLGECIPVAPFAMPGDPKNPEIIARMLSISNTFMLCGNGVLSVGTDVTQAYLRLELVEHLSKIDFIATRLGQPAVLSAEDVDRLLEKRAAAGLEPPGYKPRADKPGDLRAEMDIQRIIEEEVADALKRISK